MDIKKIIHIADVHIRTYKRHNEYREQLSKLISESSEYISINNLNKEEVRIILAGDIVHQKVTISNEQTDMVGWFLKELSNICLTYIILGNHDLLESNENRMDSITPIIKLMDNTNIVLLKESKCFVDNNIVFCPYSIIEHNAIPNIEEYKELYPDKTFVGIFHGVVKNAKTSLGFQFTDSETDTDYFKGCDIVLLGDQHLRQEINADNCLMAFPGSCLAQDYGESYQNHGYLIWDIESKTYQEFNLISDYGFFQFKITCPEDIQNNLEELINK